MKEPLRNSVPVTVETWKKEPDTSVLYGCRKVLAIQNDSDIIDMFDISEQYQTHKGVLET